MKITRCLTLLMFMTTCQLWSGIQACRKNCRGQEGLAESLRPFFESCMQEKLGPVVTWKYIVNYVVWDDIWFTATQDFFCKDKDESCWIKQADNFLLPSSKYLQPMKECIGEYSANPPNTTRPCERAELPVYKPQVFKKFKPMKSCPLSRGQYVSCLTATAVAITRTKSAKPGEKFLTPRYNFIDLSSFLTKHRSNCKITNYRSSSYVTTCAKNKAPTISKPTTPQALNTVRGKRALSLRELLANVAGGRLHLRVSSSGEAKILPSGPLIPKIPIAPKCFAQKLQLAMKARTVLSTSVSRCNTEASKQVTRRVSTSFTIGKKIKVEPGQKGKCKPEQVWTPWYNTDDPSRSGDMEYFSRIRRKNMMDVCYNPSAVQALLAKNNASYETAGQVVKIEPRFGLSCHNYKQKSRKCEDYKVRFCCNKI